MNNYIDEFNFNKKTNKLLKIIKIVLIMIIVFIIGTIVIRNCSRIFDDNGVPVESELKEDAKYSMDKPFRELGIYTQSDLDEYLHEVAKYLKPKEFQNLINWAEAKYYGFENNNWDAYESGWDILEQQFEWPTHDELIRRIVYKGNDWSMLPLSGNFKKKFNGESIPEYYGYKEERVTHYYYDGSGTIFLSIFNNGTTFSIDEFTGNGEETNRLYFKYSFDENGYLDDVVFEKSIPTYDKYGNYVTKKDKYLMNNESSVEIILKNIIPHESYNYDDDPGNVGYNPAASPFYYENVWKEIGMTDAFRKYFDNLHGEGFLPKEGIRKEIYDNQLAILDIENIDIENRHAIIQVTLKQEEIVKYYDVYWTTDEEYKLDSIDVKLNREEKLIDKD